MVSTTSSSRSSFQTAPSSPIQTDHYVERMVIEEFIYVKKDLEWMDDSKLVDEYLSKLIHLALESSKFDKEYHQKKDLQIDSIIIEEEVDELMLTTNDHSIDEPNLIEKTFNALIDNAEDVAFAVSDYVNDTISAIFNKETSRVNLTELLSPTRYSSTNHDTSMSVDEFILNEEEIQFPNIVQDNDSVMITNYIHDILAFLEPKHGFCIEDDCSSDYENSPVNETDITILSNKAIAALETILSDEKCDSVRNEMFDISVDEELEFNHSMNLDNMIHDFISDILQQVFEDFIHHSLSQTATIDSRENINITNSTESVIQEFVQTESKVKTIVSLLESQISVMDTTETHIPLTQTIVSVETETKEYHFEDDSRFLSNGRLKDNSLEVHVLETANVGSNASLSDETQTDSIDGDDLNYQEAIVPLETVPELRKVDSEDTIHEDVLEPVIYGPPEYIVQNQKEPLKEDIRLNIDESCSVKSEKFNSSAELSLTEFQKDCSNLKASNQWIPEPIDPSLTQAVLIPASNYFNQEASSTDTSLVHEMEEQSTPETHFTTANLTVEPPVFDTVQKELTQFESTIVEIPSVPLPAWTKESHYIKITEKSHKQTYFDVAKQLAKPIALKTMEERQGQLCQSGQMYLVFKEHVSRHNYQEKQHQTIMMENPVLVHEKYSTPNNELTDLKCVLDRLDVIMKETDALGRLLIQREINEPILKKQISICAHRMCQLSLDLVWTWLPLVQRHAHMGIRKRALTVLFNLEISGFKVKHMSTFRRKEIELLYHALKKLANDFTETTIILESICTFFNS